jgi:hypothetical protein
VFLCARPNRHHSTYESHYTTYLRILPGTQQNRRHHGADTTDADAMRCDGQRCLHPNASPERSDISRHHSTSAVSHFLASLPCLFYLLICNSFGHIIYLEPSSQAPEALRSRGAVSGTWNGRLVRSKHTDFGESSNSAQTPVLRHMLTCRKREGMLCWDTSTAMESFRPACISEPRSYTESVDLIGQVSEEDL